MFDLDTEVWVTQMNLRITAVEMDDQHLLNLIEYLQKPRCLEGFKQRIIEKLLSTPGPNGHCTQLDKFLGPSAHAAVFYHILQPSVLWQSLVAEADRRGLEYALIFSTNRRRQ